MKGFTVRAALFASIGGFFTSYYSSILGVVEMEVFWDSFPSSFPVEEMMSNSSLNTCGSGSSSKDLYTGILGSIGYVGAAIGSALSGKFSDRFSRTYGMMACGFISLGGSALVTASYYNQIWMVIVGRTITGISAGAIFVIGPVYVAEISRKKTRGLMVSLFSLTYGLGSFIALGISAGVQEIREGWRISYATLGLLGLVYAIGCLFLPHSPWWLVSKNRDKEALYVLSKIHSSDYKLEALFHLEDLKEARSEKRIKRNSFSLFMKWKYVWRLIILGLLFTITALYATTIVLYPVTLLCRTGVSRPFISSVVLGLCNVVAVLISLVLIDKVGRKTLLVAPAILNAFLCALAGALLHVYGTSNTGVNYAIVVIVCVFAFSLYLGWMAIPWIIAAESFPHEVVGIGASLANAIYWTVSIITSFVFPLLINPPFYIHGFLYIAAVFSVIGAVFVTLAIPETKGVSIEHIDEVFAQKWIRRIDFRQSLVHREDFKCVKSPDVK